MFYLFEWLGPDKILLFGSGLRDPCGYKFRMPLLQAEFASASVKNSVNYMGVWAQYRPLVQTYAFQLPQSLVSPW